MIAPVARHAAELEHFGAPTSFAMVEEVHHGADFASSHLVARAWNIGDTSAINIFFCIRDAFSIRWYE